MTAPWGSGNSSEELWEDFSSDVVESLDGELASWWPLPLVSSFRSGGCISLVRRSLYRERMNYKREISKFDVNANEVLY